MLAIAFLFGTLTLLCTPSCALFLFLFIFFQTIVFKPWRKAGLFFLSAIVLAWGHVAWRLHESIPQGLEKKWVNVSGTVLTPPRQHGRHTQFLFQIRSPFSLKVQLHVFFKQVDLKAGERVAVRVRLKHNHALSNLRFSFLEDRWFYQGIRAQGTLKPGSIHVLQHPKRSMMRRMQSHLEQRVLDSVHDKDMSGLILALLLGESHRLSPHLWDIFQATGTTHLMAISGLHLGIVYGIFYAVVFFLWRCGVRLCVLLPAQKAGVLGGLCASFLYGALSGFSIPTLRAFLMIAWASVFFLWDRYIRSVTVLGYGLISLLMVDPFSVLMPGFWLSFWMVTCLITSARSETGMHAVFSMHLKTVLWGVPLCMAFFHQQSLSAPMANLIAIPWVALCILPLLVVFALLSGIHGLSAAWVLKGAAMGLKGLLWFLGKCAKVPVWHVGAMSMTALLLATACFYQGLKIFKTMRLAGGFLILLGVISLMGNVQTPLQSGQFRLWVLDVGQGLSVLVQTKHHVLLYDTGTRTPNGADMGQRVIVPSLQALGIAQLDKLVISHDDLDHRGGAFSVLKSIPVKHIQASYPKRFHGAKPCLKGQHFQWEGVSFQFLSPKHRTPYLKNNSSCVLHIDNGNVSVLLPGDIERETEANLLKSPEILSSTLLIVPHHGSHTSSSLSFLKAVKPHWAVFSSGYLNRYFFPHPTVLKRYQDLGVRCLNTAHRGAVYFEAGKQLKLKACLRDTQKRYWWGK